MFEYFRFSLPRAVTEQLIEKLDSLNHGKLTPHAISELVTFQKTWHTKQGVYVIYYEDRPAYVGKANKLAERLKQHRKKLSGRKGVQIDKLGFKALLLDENWSTSANEDLLIAHFRKNGVAEWNQGGFGPKDPGKERDTTKPSAFDSAYPIEDKWPVADVPDQILTQDLLQTLKKRLPFLLRYETLGVDGQKLVSLVGVPRDAHSILVKCAETLGLEWQLTLLTYGLILYRGSKEYRYGQRLFP